MTSRQGETKPGGGSRMGVGYPGHPVKKAIEPECSKCMLTTDCLDYNPSPDMIKKILIGLGVVIVIFIAVVATRPADFRVERSATIAAPAQALFEQANDHHNFNK